MNANELKERLGRITYENYVATCGEPMPTWNQVRCDIERPLAYLAWCEAGYAAWRTQIEIHDLPFVSDEDY